MKVERHQLRAVMVLVLFGLGAAACEQRPGIDPRVDRVTPDVVAVGQERFVVLTGRFGPRVSWTPGEEPSLSAAFEVQFGDQPSDLVRLDSAERLVARVPAIAEAGCVDVTVAGPGGTTSRLTDGLCLREVETTELLLGCLVGQGVPGLCSYDDLTETFAVVHTDMLWVTTPTIRSGTFDTYRLAYAFSPNGRSLLFMREVLDDPALEDASWRDRQLILRDLDAGWEALLAESRQPPIEGPESQPGFESFAELAFSPDGTRIAYVEDLVRLVIQAVPDNPQDVSPSEVVVDWTDQPRIRVGNPDFDIASTQLVFTRLRETGEGQLNNEIDLFLAPLDGSQPPVDLFPQAPQGQVNGPGSFHPAGGSVVFVSSRLGMQVASPYLLMIPATNLYRLELTNGQVEPLTVPTAGVYTGAPQMSPNGRLAANTGFIDEVAGRTLDVLITDLDLGRTARLGPDRGPFCYPQPLDSCPAGAMLGCCYAAEGDALECCDLESPELCPTYDLLPAFSPDSQALVANYMPWIWWCFTDGVQQPAWTLGLVEVGLFLGVPIPESPGQWGELAIPTDELGAAFGSMGPVFRQTLVGE